MSKKDTLLHILEELVTDFLPLRYAIIGIVEIMIILTIVQLCFYGDDLVKEYKNSKKSVVVESSENNKEVKIEKHESFTEKHEKFSITLNVLRVIGLWIFAVFAIIVGLIFLTADVTDHFPRRFIVCLIIEILVISVCFQIGSITFEVYENYQKSKIYSEVEISNLVQANDLLNSKHNNSVSKEGFSLVKLIFIHLGLLIILVLLILVGYIFIYGDLECILY